MSDQQRKYRFIKITCLTVSTTFLVTGYLLAGWWGISLIFPATWLFWKWSRYRTGIYVPSILFGSYLFLAALGIWMGLSPYLMVYGSILALATWELQLFQQRLNVRFQHSSLKYLEMVHLKSLSIVILFSFLVTTIGINFHLKLPFGITLVLIILVGFVLKRIYFYLVQQTP